MKKMSALIAVLLIVLALTSCAVMNTHLPADTAAPQISLISSGEPEQTADPVQEPAGPTAAPQKTALGNLAGNLNNGGFVVEGEDGTVYLARENGIHAVRKDGSVAILCTDNAYEMNLWDGRLYYVAREFTDGGYDYYSEHVGDSIVSIALDGGDRQVLGEKRPVRTDVQYNTEDGSRVSYTDYCGYTDLVVCGGRIYYIANNANSGSMTVRAHYDGSEAQAVWDSDKSIYSMELDGSGIVELVSNIGSGRAHMCTDGEKLYYATAYENCYFSYPFTTFHVCNLDGSEDETLIGVEYRGEEETAYSCEKGSLTEIVQGLFVSNGTLYVSATDSEGDFPNSRLMRVSDGRYEFVQDETYYVYSAAREDGALLTFNAPEDIQCAADNEGVIYEEYVENAALSLDGAPLYVFDRLVRFGDEFSSFKVSIFGDRVYLLTGSSFWRVNAADGSMEQLMGETQAGGYR